jgi:hypothetical protein
LASSQKLYGFGSNCFGQLGLPEQGFSTPLKPLVVTTKPQIIQLDSIKELSMDNSSVLRRPEDLQLMKEYIQEMESKSREGEALRELIMSETMKFISKIELKNADCQNTSTPGLSRVIVVRRIEKVGNGLT